jgi:hypothetical protein
MRLSQGESGSWAPALRVTLLVTPVPAYYGKEGVRTGKIEEADELTTSQKSAPQRARCLERNLHGSGGPQRPSLRAELCHQR